MTLAFMIAIFLNAEGNAFTAVEIYSVHPSLENCAAEVKEIREGRIYLKGTAPVWLDCVTFEDSRLIYDRYMTRAEAEALRCYGRGRSIDIVTTTRMCVAFPDDG